MLRNEAAIPSPTISVIKLGPLPIHIYALCIVAGIGLALFLTDRRWKERGGLPNQVSDVAGWAVIFGIIGGRLYHVITDPELYFKAGEHPLDALKIWDGGLGIWGAIALGAVGALIGCRRHRLSFVAFADAAVPGVILAQAIGRLGNWFNNELYGRPTSLPWKLAIHNMDLSTGRPQPCDTGTAHGLICGYYHPTFLYELLWNVAIGLLLLWADRRFRLARGQVFALYVMGYTAGRVWIEAMRSDHANRILGLRVNDWVSVAVFLFGLGLFLRQRGKPRSTALASDPEVPGGEAPSPEASTPETPSAGSGDGDSAAQPAASGAAGITDDPELGTPDPGQSDATDLPSPHGEQPNPAGAAKLADGATGSTGD